ncbi:hypothetical protein ACFQPG_01490 [Sphingomonas sp. GCM10030256]|uniref:hypothetical protein n=1 Tax=Sphingomonas sp. GCM10030256 TaxID=3273427 RepID=UPI003620D0A3
MGHFEQIRSEHMPHEEALPRDPPALPVTPLNDSSTKLRPSTVAVALFAALEQEGIRYCHWKSNIRLDGTLVGTEDIDVLVHPADAHGFQRVINECGFKLTVSRMGVGHPGVFHAIGRDPESGQFFDLHAYHQLISGDSLVKSYRFPVEEELLACTTSQMGVRVPTASAELVLFLLRILLKHTSLIEVRKVNGSYGECRTELAWLLARSDLGEAARLRDEWFPTLQMPLQDMIDCVAKGTVAARAGMGLRLAWALRRHRRLGHLAGAASRMTRFVIKHLSRWRSRRNLSLLAGGTWIALVGPKGTGKSTLTKVLAKQLGSKLTVQQIHFGKPPASWLTFVPRRVVPAVRKALSSKRSADRDGSGQSLKARYSTWFVVSKWLVAIDRQRLLTRSMRQVASGTILISDRCHVTNGTGMDGSAFDDLAVARARSPLQRWLMEQERAIYRHLPRPRLVFKLCVPLETALQRDLARHKAGGPNPQAIKRRWDVESQSEFARSTVCLIDTDGDIDDTSRTIAARVWQSI